MESICAELASAANAEIEIRKDQENKNKETKALRDKHVSEVQNFLSLLASIPCRVDGNKKYYFSFAKGQEANKMPGGRQINSAGKDDSFSRLMYVCDEKGHIRNMEDYEAIFISFDEEDGGDIRFMVRSSGLFSNFKDKARVSTLEEVNRLVMGWAVKTDPFLCSNAGKFINKKKTGQKRSPK